VAIFDKIETSACVIAGCFDIGAFAFGAVFFGGAFVFVFAFAFFLPGIVDLIREAFVAWCSSPPEAAGPAEDVSGRQLLK
jgi:hypothetical protein